MGGHLFNQRQIQMDAAKKGLDPGQVIKANQGDHRRSAPANPIRQPQERDPLPVAAPDHGPFRAGSGFRVKILDNKKSGLTLWTHPYSQQGFSANMANTFRFSAWRSMPGFAGIDPRYIIGSPTFNLNAILKEALASMPEQFGKAAVASTIKVNVVAGSVFVMVGSSVKFFADLRKQS